jgi:transaldolase
VEWGIIDGVTTNPSLAAKVSKPYSDIVQEILALVKNPVSLEAIFTYAKAS